MSKNLNTEEIKAVKSVREGIVKEQQIVKK